jgi:hypothetical protein
MLVHGAMDTVAGHGRTRMGGGDEVGPDEDLPYIEVPAAITAP